MYKVESDGLKSDAIFHKGYKYQTFMCNDPVPKTYLANRLPPFHARLMALFGTVDEKHHQCAM